MVSAYAKTKYLLDTNILIKFCYWKPIELRLNDFFWSELSNKLKRGEWVLVDVVVNEITREGKLKDWCEEQVKNGFVVKVDDSVRKRAVEINNLYEMIDQYSGNSTVDTYIIAYAKANGLGVFSDEMKRIGTGLYKIPDVCELLGIRHTRQPIVFLKNVGFD
jgi:predicted nucleic acid-binding protein